MVGTSNKSVPGMAIEYIYMQTWSFQPSEKSGFPDIVVDAKGFVELRQGRHQGTNDHGIFSEMNRTENGATEHLGDTKCRKLPFIVELPIKIIKMVILPEGTTKIP